MPKKRRNRKYKKRQGRPPQLEDGVLRTCPANESLDTSSKLGEINHRVRTSEAKADIGELATPELPMVRGGSRVRLQSRCRKRRSQSRESTGYGAGHAAYHNSGEGLVSDVRNCQSSILLDKPVVEGKVKVAASVAMVTQEKDTVTPSFREDASPCQSLTETPRPWQDDLFDFEHLQDRSTPIKRLRTDSATPLFDVNNSLQRIQDLNCLQKVQDELKLSCSRVINGDSLRRLQNFNELLLSTSQSVEHEIDEQREKSVDEIELSRSDEFSALENVSNGEATLSPKASENLNSSINEELSFFTPHLFNLKLMSTPIEHPDRRDELCPIPEKVEIVQHEPVPRTSEVAVQIRLPHARDISVQTVFTEDKATSPPRFKRDAVTRRRSYKSLSPSRTYSRAVREARMSPSQARSLERIASRDTIAAIETCAKIVTKMKKYHVRYSAKISAKIVELCRSLGQAVKRGLSSIYKLYSRHNLSEESCSSCSSYAAQIDCLTTTVSHLEVRMDHMKKEFAEKCHKLAMLGSEVSALRRELTEFESIKSEISKLKENASKPAVAPPPPPPPPPPLPMPTTGIAVIKTPNKSAKKKAENARPIISLDDILKVKLRKTGERVTPIQRRVTEPLVTMSVLKQVKLRPVTPSSNGSDSSLASSPCSSLTRMLTGEANVIRVKRLRRVGGYSFDDFCRRNRREREF